jgi:hypothetical protein
MLLIPNTRRNFTISFASATYDQNIRDVRQLATNLLSHACIQINCFCNTFTTIRRSNGNPDASLDRKRLRSVGSINAHRNCLESIDAWHRFAGVRLPAWISPQKASPDSQHTNSENEDNRIRSYQCILTPPE